LTAAIDSGLGSRPTNCAASWLGVSPASRGISKKITKVTALTTNSSTIAARIRLMM